MKLLRRRKNKMKTPEIFSIFDNAAIVDEIEVHSRSSIVSLPCAFSVPI
jgi:hypothetical protein